MALRRLLALTCLSGMCACTLISGASDLTIADLGPEPGPGVDAEGADRAAPPTRDAASADAGPSDGAAADAPPVSDAGDAGAGPCGSDPTLIMYYAFDGADGGVVNNCAPPLTGTLTNGAAIGPGKRGSGVLVTDGWVEFGSPTPLRITGALTVSVWVKPSNLPAAGRADYIFGRRASQGGAGYRLALEPGSVSFLAANATNQAEANGANITVNQWVHLAGVFEPGAAVRVYIAGTQSAMSPATTVLTAGAETLATRAGARADGNPFTRYHGSIDELRLYGRALGPQEIAALAAP